MWSKDWDKSRPSSGSSAATTHCVRKTEMKRKKMIIPKRAELKIPYRPGIK